MDSQIRQQCVDDYVENSKIRQQYPEDCEGSINKLINLKLYASYTFLSISYHFGRDDVSLPGMFKFFQTASLVEKDHAEKLMKYQNQRGGRVVLQAIPAPLQQEWGSGAEAIKFALDLKKQVNQSVLDLHKLASSKNDPSTNHFIDDFFINEHVEAIKKLGDMSTQLRRVGLKDLGLYMFDKEFL